MRDPMTFEARLADAFDRYVAPVDVDVDARALSSTFAAAGRRARPSWHSLLMPDRRAIQVALVAVLLLALLFAALQAGRRPPPPPFGVAGNGLVAYVDGGDVFVADPFGNRDARAIRAPGEQLEAAFSLDGRRLVAVVRRDDSGFDLQVTDVDAPDWRTVNPQPLDEVYTVGWLPDGRTLYVVAPQDRVGRLQLLDADGRLQPRRIDWPGDVTDAQARPPDGRQLLVRRALGGKVGLFLLDLTDGTITTVVRPRHRGNADRDLVDAEWSPDGSTIAFQAWSDDPPVMQVFTLRLDGSMPRRLTHDDRAWYEGWPHWSPDGRRMAILRLFYDASGQPTLDERPVAIAWVDGHAATIESGPIMSGNARLLEWSPDGRWIIEHSEDDAQLLVDPDGGPPVGLPWDSTSPSSWQRVATAGD